MLVHRIELKEQHIETLQKYGVDTERIRIESVFTEARRLGEHEQPLLIVFDEAHLSRAASWERVLEYYSASWVIGVTATPARLDGRPLGSTFQAMVQGITHKELEALGCLAPYDYYAPSELDLSNVRKKAGDFDEHEVEDLVCTRTVYGDVIKHYRQFAAGKRAIAFCVSVRHGREVAEEFCAAGIKAVSLDGSMSKSTRSDVMRQFRDGNIAVLTTCGLLAEGIDIPALDCVLLLRPTDSLPLYIQQSCRCLRADPDNPDKRAVILDFVGNYSRHSTPSADRDWTLENGVTRHKEYNEDGSLALRVCNFCFKTFETAPKCPFCGEEYELKSREVQKMKEVELHRIELAEAEAEQKRKAEAAQDIRNARSYEDFLKIARKNGYSPQWARIRARCRGYKI